MNLVKNAINFSHQAGGFILIKTGYVEGELVVNVEDTGVGIAIKDFKKLFKCF